MATLDWVVLSRYVDDSYVWMPQKSGDFLKNNSQQLIISLEKGFGGVSFRIKLNYLYGLQILVK